MNEVEGAVGVTACDGSLIDGEFDDFFVFEQWGFPFGESGVEVTPELIHSFGVHLRFAFVVRVVHVIGVRDSVIGMESVGGGKDFGEVSEVPFADAGGEVAVRGKMVGEGVFFGIKAVVGGGKEDSFL